MQTFTDNAGRKWLVEINVFQIKRVKATLGIDLKSLIENEMRNLADLVGDAEKLVDVLFVLCQDQAKELSVSDEQFGRAMAGDSILEAQNAFLEAYANFCPNPKVRENFRKLLVKSQEMTSKLMEATASEIERINLDEIVSEIRLQQKRLTPLSGDVPA